MAEALAGNVIRFVELLRAAGADVHAGSGVDAVTALLLVGVSRRADVRAALRSLLVHRREDLPVFEDAFERFWRARSRRDAGSLPLVALGERPRLTAAPRAGTPVELEASSGEASTIPRRGAAAWSALESLRTRDLADLTPAELQRAELLLARLPWQLGVRRTRRWVRARAGRLDLRRLVRANIRHGGEPLDLPRRTRGKRPRPVVVLADVSGSMERYARVLLQFMHGMAAGPHTVESFLFATRLTRVTRELARGGRGRGVATVMRRVRDWGGGTRIGEALRTFNRHHARRVMRHGPVVLVISDGWDRGDPAQLARELARVRRSCRRLVWLNPLLGSDGYEPLTRGMQAALPFVDDFLPAHNVASLEALAARLRALDHAD